MHIFRHFAPKFLDIRQYACEILVQSDEKSDGASEALWFLEVPITKSECDFEIISGRFVVDAKSIMGIFSLDLSKKLMLVIQSDDECEIDKIKDKIGSFIIE